VLLSMYHPTESMAMPQHDSGSSSDTQDQDTPGRPKPSASRQQTQPNQGAQTGNSEVDSKGGHQPHNDHHVRNEK
jgi:hypothetical protein